jgi:hypothetical protein
VKDQNSDRISLDKTQHEHLLFSEHALAAIPKHKFKLDSWSSLDLFMDFAAELFGFTVKELIAHGYLKITESEKIPVKFLRMRISTRTELLIHRLPKSTKGLTVGWLEEKILNTLKTSQTSSLQTITFTVFSDIIHEKDTYTNPGKVFIYELLKHQKSKRFQVEEKNIPLTFSKQITITPITPLPDDGKERSIYVTPANEQFVQIIETIGSQLRRFQDLD